MIFGSSLWNSEEHFIRRCKEIYLPFFLLVFLVSSVQLAPASRLHHQLVLLLLVPISKKKQQHVYQIRICYVYWLVNRLCCCLIVHTLRLRSSNTPPITSSAETSLGCIFCFLDLEVLAPAPFISKPIKKNMNSIFWKHSTEFKRAFYKTL